MHYVENPPEYIIPFGRHKGSTLIQIYQFDPHYLEWLIEYSDILIDIDKFKPFPNLSRDIDITDLSPKDRLLSHADSVSNAIRWLQQGNAFIAAKFIFSERTMEILGQKKTGSYRKPNVD